jgi:hypothetical protein
MDEAKSCSVCGTPLSTTDKCCPVCMLRQALGGEGESGDSSLGESVQTTPEEAAQRFAHYELVKNEGGTPVELGRGAMGITYKAFDVDLHRPAALKVISERYLGDEAARLRFLREARAAARVRHMNVASVFHLGRTGQNYFYTMEFVAGETLEYLIKRSRQIEVKLALEIVTQVAAGLTAIQKEKLVHRDIKPSNIMVSLDKGNVVTAKIIDLGLAKTADEAGSQTAISIPGGFAGTPEFASPEQFAGVQVDIRSDLYSLGTTLWTMLVGQAPFRGTAAELMYQHMQAPLPLEQLKGVPQPVVVLLEGLLEKDPAGRLQNPSEVLKAMPTILAAISARRRINRQNFNKIPPGGSRVGTRKPPARLALKKISVARLPVTGSEVFGREEDIAFLDRAWANQQVNIVTLVAWAGVGKSTLVNHWLRRMATDHYRSAELIFGWSFYRQGTSGDTSSADEFIDAALTWFGDQDPQLGTEWEKGERLAKLVALSRTLLVLDGLEPLQNPPGSQEGRLREPSLQALLRELAAFNTGLCLVTTRTPVADIADHEGTSALRRDLEHLSSDAGAKLLRSLGVEGQEAELRRASDEFSGHSFALTLLGSYLTDAYNGDIRCLSEVSGHLADDARQGVHARKLMQSYQIWFGEGPELSVLRMLGLFDRPVDEETLGVLLKSPAIPGLTESLIEVRSTVWRTILARLRRARLLAGEDPHNPGQLDTHPLVREYFGEQLRSQQTDAWKECNRRLYHYYRTLAPELPNNFREMEPLFSAVICGCHAGLFREVLHEVYLPRIQRGITSFAANVLGARGPLLSVLVYFFKQARWESPVEMGLEEHSLTADDQLFVLTQAALYLSALRGHSSLEACICYERLESLSNSLHRPRVLYVALQGQWRYYYKTNKPSAALKIAERVHAMAQEQDDPVLMIGACNLLAGTLFYLGDIGTAHQYAMRSVQIWRSGGMQSCSLEGELESRAVVCLGMTAICEWHLGQVASCQSLIDEALSLAKELNDMSALALALQWATNLAYYERNPTEVERLASDSIELSTRHSFPHWLTHGTILRGWARSALGDTTEGIAWIEDGIRDFRVAGAMQELPFLLALKAEALHLGSRTCGALEAIREAEALVERSGERWWCAELYRLRGVFLANLGADETQIEASFCSAIKTAKEQNSVSLAARAEASYAEYGRQKKSGLGGRGFRLPL